MYCSVKVTNLSTVILTVESSGGNNPFFVDKERIVQIILQGKGKKFAGVVVGQYSGDRMHSTVFSKIAWGTWEHRDVPTDSELSRTARTDDHSKVTV
jgi:hypothetical protein